MIEGAVRLRRLVLPLLLILSILSHHDVGNAVPGSLLQQSVGVRAFSPPVPIQRHRRSLEERFRGCCLSIRFGGKSEGDNSSQLKIRLNKVFKRTHSRREADRLIEAGRVSVNGKRVATKGGFFVVPYVDEVCLDGNVVEGWEEMNYVAGSDSNIPTTSRSKQNKQMSTTSGQKPNNSEPTTRKTFEYIKYWKPRGVICTTDTKIPHNILDEIKHDGYDPPHRVYPVGRLDKDTSGLILLTSDGRLPNAALRKEHKRPKVYEVGLDRPIQDSANVLKKLRNGVLISTETVRNGVRKTLTAPTEPCQVEQLADRWLRITLKEGRNRQVRKMTQAVGYKTVELERVAFASIPLEPGLRGPGDWDYLKGRELKIVQDIIEQAKAAPLDKDEYTSNDVGW